jgi:hypothetical protein
MYGKLCTFLMIYAEIYIKYLSFGGGAYNVALKELSTTFNSLAKG